MGLVDCPVPLFRVRRFLYQLAANVQLVKLQRRGNFILFIVLFKKLKNDVIFDVSTVKIFEDYSQICFKSEKNAGNFSF